MSKKPPYIARPLSPDSKEAARRALLKKESKFSEDPSFLDFVDAVLGLELSYDTATREITAPNEEGVLEEMIMKRMEPEKLVTSGGKSVEDVKKEMTKRARNIADGIRKLLKNLDSQAKEITQDSVKPQFIKGTRSKSGDDKILVFSPYRNSIEIKEYQRDLTERLVVIGHIAQALDTINDSLGASFELETLPAKFSQAVADIGCYYARDAFLVIGEAVYLYSDREKNLPEEYGDQFKAARADLKGLFGDGIQIKDLPLPIDGGNVLVDENKNLLVINPFFKNDLEEEVEKNGNSVSLDKRAFVEYEGKKTTYKDFIPKIEEWFKSNTGYNVLIIKPNFRNKKTKTRTPYLELYHADCYANIATLVKEDGTATSYIILPEEGFLEESCEKKIIEEYGAENVIRMSAQERKNMCSNFAVLGNNVILTKPGKASESFAKKLLEKGFGVFIPPISLQLSPDSGLRCIFQMSPKAKEKESISAISDSSAAAAVVAVEAEAAAAAAAGVAAPAVDIATKTAKPDFVIRHFEQVNNGGTKLNFKPK